MTWEMWADKGMNAAVVLLFFAAAIWFLRFLYGPKGKLRDPQWDQWNADARRQLEKELDAKADAALREEYLAYAHSFFTGEPAHDDPLRLKIEHTFKVVAHAGELAASEPSLADRSAARPLKLAALFHDVGRFEQFRRYQTFADDLSCNHGRLGAQVLRAQGFLKYESPDIQRLAVLAVALHNRFSVPEKLGGTARDVLCALRDADKLDIMRIMAAHLGPEPVPDSVVLLHLADEPASYSPPVLAALEEGRSALYRDMRFYNDFRILLCTWLYSLHYGTSYHILKCEGHLDNVIAGLGGIPEVREKVRSTVNGILEKAR